MEYQIPMAVVDRLISGVYGGSASFPPESAHGPADPVAEGLP
ncbi:MAG: hypothetical protein OXC95_03040 [Dehalococcoidia bacterium]|nr:hypothetical protein [Dehalococcoidia bacterium]